MRLCFEVNYTKGVSNLMPRSKKLAHLNTSFEDYRDEVAFILHELANGKKVRRDYLAQLLIEATTHADNMQENTIDTLIERIAGANGFAPDDASSVLEALAGLNSTSNRKRTLHFLREALPDLLAELELELPFENETEYGQRPRTSGRGES